MVFVSCFTYKCIPFLGEEEETQAPAQSADDDVILVISSDEEESHPPARKRKGSSSSSSSSSGSDDDLIVVKTEHNTIDPITKKQIVDPVRNKKCNHIYEKSTIYSMIDLARENSKPVKCPYMGCNERDFKKTDLVRDKTVLNHISEMNNQKEKEELENKKKESEKKKNKGNESDHSITLDIDDDEEDEHNKSTEFEVSGIADPNLSESSSEETIFNTQSSTSPMTSSFNSVNNITVTTNTNTDERQVELSKLSVFEFFNSKIIKGSLEIVHKLLVWEIIINCYPQEHIMSIEILFPKGSQIFLKMKFFLI